MTFQQYIKQRRAWVDQSLRSYLPKANRKPSLLHGAIRYSLFAGGKRLRPILVLAAMEAVTHGNARGKSAIKRGLPAASAIELIHTYSLVHDDLPAMDDDDLRRGRPTNHKVFGEPVAILVGDSLLTAAFALLAGPKNGSRMESALWLKVVHELGEAAGSTGLVGGQLMDIQSQGRSIDENMLRYIHIHKTGALIRASVRIGGIVGGASARDLRALSEYGEKIGLAFQIADDILDVEGDPGLMGKRVRKDHAAQKITYPGVIGIRRSKAYSRKLHKEAVASLSCFNHRADPLRDLARYMVEREH